MSFTDLLNQTCTYGVNNTTNQYGDLSFANGKTIKCRFAKTGKGLSQFAQGMISEKSAQLWLDTSVTPQVDDKVIIKSVAYTVRFIEEFVEDDGETLGYKLLIDQYA